MIVRYQAILLRFPECHYKIMKRIEENEDFDCLCSDYGECVKMLEKLSTDSVLADALQEQYLELKIELENEVLRLLKK